MLCPDLIFRVGWHVPEYSKGMMEYNSPRPSSTQGRATLTPVTLKLKLDKAPE